MKSRFASQLKLTTLIASLITAALSNQLFAASVIENTITTSGTTGIALDASSTPTNVNATSIGVTGTGGGGYSTDTRTATTPVTEVNTNQVNNTETIVNSATNNSNGIASVNLSSDNVATATAYASNYESGNSAISSAATTLATATADSTVSTNTVDNAGSLTGDIGIQLKSTTNASASATAVSDAWSNNDGSQTGELPTSTATTTATATAASLVTSNTVTNTGTITGADLGINLQSISNAADTANSVANRKMGNDSGPDTPYQVLTNGTQAMSSSSTVDSYVAGNSITNSGQLVVTAGSGISLLSQAGIGSSVDSAIALVNANAINNSGTTSAAGASSDGIYLHAQAAGATNVAEVKSNTISNTGLLYAGRNAISLTATESTTDASIVSENTISNPYNARVVAGNISVYISAENVNRNTITNSGLIVSDPGMSLSGTTLSKSSPSTWNPTATGSGQAIAIQIDAVATTTDGQENNLNLSAPGYLAGRILLGSNSKTNVNLTSGVSHSVRWAFQHESNYSQADQESAYSWSGGSTTFASLSGTVPWFVNEQAEDVNGIVNDVYATVDPTAFAAAPNQLADLTNMVSNISREGLAKNTDAANGFWLSAQGGSMNYDGNSFSTMNQDTKLYSIALGYNRTVLDDYRVGLIVGYSNNKFDSGSFYNDLYSHSYDNKAAGGYLGARAMTKLGPFDFDAGLAGGFQRHDDKRFVNDNLVWWGQSTANSSYTSYWFSPEIGLTMPIPLAAGFILSPNARLTYSGQHIKSYTETGTNANASFDSRYIGVIEGKMGLRISNSFGPLNVSADVGHMSRSLTDDESVRTTMIGDVHDLSFDYRNVSAGYVTAKVGLNITDNLEANLIGTYTRGSNAEGGNVMGTVKVTF